MAQGGREMICTDHDLEAYKRLGSFYESVFLSKDNFNSIIARLEAAEKLLHSQEMKGNLDPFDPEVREWRQAAGKPPTGGVSE